MMNGQLPLLCSYRAEFSGPMGALNPSGWKVPGKIGVEIRQVAGFWSAFRPDTKYQFAEITPQLDAKTVQNQMKLYFEKQVSPWVLCELTEPGSKAVPLDPSKITWDAKGRVYKKETKKA